MNLIDRATINRFHDTRTLEFGVGTVEALGWYDIKDQGTRFEILSGIANLDGCVVLDIGCGYGDLYPFLLEKYNIRNYIGLDNNTSFLDIAVGRYGNESNIKFLLGDFTGAVLPETDYILCSGALSYHTQDPDFIKPMIEKLFHSCRHGLGFNLLSKVKNPGGILVAYEPEEILNICRQLTPNVQLHDEYLPGDFSVFLYH